MTTDNKELSRRILEEVWNHQNLDAVDGFIAADFVQHDPQIANGVRGIEAYKQFVRYYLAAFPDLHFTVENQLSEGSTVATRWTVTGTHSGDLSGIPATGRPISLTGITCSRLVDGKFVESWSNWDALGMLQQLGAIPAQRVEKAA